MPSLTPITPGTITVGSPGVGTLGIAVAAPVNGAYPGVSTFPSSSVYPGVGLTLSTASLGAITTTPRTPGAVTATGISPASGLYPSSSTFPGSVYPGAGSSATPMVPTTITLARVDPSYGAAYPDAPYAYPDFTWPDAPVSSSARVVTATPVTPGSFSPYLGNTYPSSTTYPGAFLLPGVTTRSMTLTPVNPVTL